MGKTIGTNAGYAVAHAALIHACDPFQGRAARTLATVGDAIAMWERSQLAPIAKVRGMRGAA